MAPSSATYQAFLNSQKKIRIAEKTSFTKNSFLIFGGEKDKDESSFPGDIGPMYLNEISFTTADPILSSNLFSSSTTALDFRLMPSDVTNKSVLKNLMQARAPDDEASKFGPDPTVQFQVFSPYDDKEKKGTFIAIGQKLKTFPSQKTNKVTQIDLKEYKNTEAIIINIALEFYNDGAYMYPATADPNYKETFFRFDIYGKTFLLKQSRLSTTLGGQTFLSLGGIDLQLATMRINYGNVFGIEFHIYPSSGFMNIIIQRGIVLPV